MKILHIYNQREVWGGEDYMVDASVNVLARHGENVATWTIRNADCLIGLRGKVRAFLSGIYSFSMKREMIRRLRQNRPDVVHAHNLYPLLSASVLTACSELGVPVVVHCHNHFLTCPIGTHLRQGAICEKCTQGAVLPCIWYNCRGNILQSVGYAVRTKVARWMGWFRTDVTKLIVLTEFARKRLLRLGYKDCQLTVLPNVVISPAIDAARVPGSYVVYVGRLSPEKGVSVLMRAASELPEIEFRIAGEGPSWTELQRTAPVNVRFEGWLDKKQLSDLYAGARFCVAPSICYETFGLAAADAMAHGLPVIGSNLGGLAEIIDDNVTGLLFETGNSQELAAKIRCLWHDPDGAVRMGGAARLKATRYYSEDAYYSRLKTIYNSAIREVEK